jgi:hypothetical protein
MPLGRPRGYQDGAALLGRMPDHLLDWPPGDITRQDIATIRERFAVWPR